MIGEKRINNIQFCVEQAIRDGVPGDLIETGVWRGGAVIFMRAILKANSVTDRTVWVADSFEGLPRPDREKYPADAGDRGAIAASIEKMVMEVQNYVPGYRLKQEIQFELIGANRPLHIPEMGGHFTGLKVSTFIEVEGAGHYLPAYAGNLDIMTSAALRTGEKRARHRMERQPP